MGILPSRPLVEDKMQQAAKCDEVKQTSNIFRIFV